VLSLLLVPALSVSLNALSLPNALLFEAIRDRDGRAVLFIRDCGWGNLPQDVTSLGVSRCEEWQESFSGPGWYKRQSGDRYQYEGDAALLRRILQQRRFEEAWLFSGGGDLHSGVAIGQLLRAARLTVRVPSVERVQAAMPWPSPDTHVRCVSSCTVAFMGGFFRFLDAGSTYEVHSASRVLSEVDSARKNLMLRGEMRRVASLACGSARYWAPKLFYYFQNTLLLPTRNPPVAENESEYEQYSARGTAGVEYTATDESADLNRIRLEGVQALQDIYMRLERDCMKAIIADLRRQPAASRPRAGPALNMVETMYTVSIKETQSLSRETMLRMGFLTQEVSVAPHQ
jgi:hypothetical protein